MTGPEQSGELTGRLLVATPALGDPNFARAVVLVLDHDEEGALGVVINRPTPVEVAQVLPSWQPFTTSPGVLFQGGPVALDSALGLAVVPGKDDEEPLGFRRVVDGLGLIDLDTPPEILAAEMVDLRIFAGYAGWGSGQLEAELEEGAWYVVESERRDAFTDEPDQLWRSVLRRQGGDLALVSTYPDDPSMN
jgi:putative transcriptional regulator